MTVARKIPTVRIDYPKHWFVLGTIVWGFGTVVLIYLAYAATEDFTRAFWIVAAIFEGILLSYLFVLPLFTFHVAGAKALNIRMGALINVSVPYEWIREVRETSIHWGGVRVGVGVRFSPIMKALFVTSSFRTLVLIKLDSEHRLGDLLNRPVQEIVLSVHSASALIDVIQQRAGMERV